MATSELPSSNQQFPLPRISPRSALLVATLFPFLALPVWAWLDPLGRWGETPSGKLLLLFSTGHVAATLFFYIDRGARDFRRERPWIFLIAPVAFCLLLTVASATYPEQSFSLFMSAHVLILFYHYQRQNFGITSLVNGGLSQQAKSLLNVLLLAPVVPASIVWSERLGLYELPAAIISQIAFYAIPASLLMAAAFLLRHAKELSLRAAIIGFLGMNFFMPFFLYPDSPAVAFSAFATAHGAQYLVMMGFMALGTGQLLYLMALACSILAGILFFEHAIVGLVVGLTWSHFLIDARIWRMSNPDSRAYVASRLGQFLHPKKG